MRLPNTLRGSVTGAVLLLGMLLRFASTPCLLGASLSCVGMAMDAAERSEPRRTYNLPRGDAASTLRQFATVSGRPVFFMMDKVQGEQTNAIAGEYTPAEALHRMLAGTALAVLQQDGDEEFVVGRRPVTALRGEVGNDKPQPKSEPMNPSKTHGKLRAWLAHLAMAAATTATGQQSQESTTAPDKDGDVVVLSPFTVGAASNVGYGATSLGSNGRLNTRYIDVTQSVSVVTSEFMKDARLTDTAKALLFVPNVQVTRGVDFPAYSIRGLPTGPAYIDGFTFTNSAPTISTAFTDRVEIVKGPSPTSFGRGNPAGFVNFVAKSPLFTEATEINTTLGTGSTRTNAGVSIDNNGFVTSSHNTAYRFVGEYTVGSGTTNRSEFSRVGALLGVKHRISDRGTFKVTAQHIESSNSSRIGNRSFNDPTLQRVFTAPVVSLVPSNIPVFDGDFAFSYDSDGLKSNLSYITGVWDYQLTGWLYTRQAFSYATSDTSGQVTGANAGTVRNEAVGLTFGTGPVMFDYADHRWSYQSDFLAQWESAWLQSKHSLTFGADYSNETGIAAFLGGAAPRQLLLAFNPAQPITYSGDINKAGLLTKGNTWSPYIEAQSKLFEGRFQATVAGRYVYVDQTTTERSAGGRTISKFRTPLLPMGSLLYKPARWLSLYALMSKYQENPTTIFKYDPLRTILPSSDPRYNETITGQPTTELREIGVKGNLLEDKLTFTVSAFAIETSGVPRSVIIGDPIYPQLGMHFTSTDKTNGWEVEVFGQPTSKLTFMLGGAALTGDLTVPFGSTIYKLKPPGTPATASWYVKYAFGDNMKSGFTARFGGKTYFSGWNANVTSYGPLGNVPYPDTVTIVDFGLSYVTPRGGYEISLDVKNGFHKHAVTAGGAGYGVDGRQLFIGLKKRF